MQKKKQDFFKKELRTLVECAVLIALGIALGYIKVQLGPQGGSVDIVMVPLFIIAFRHGPLWGVGSGLVYGLLKCILVGGIGWGLPSVLLDYVLAYGAVGVAGFFKGKQKLYEVGVLLGGLLRFAVHFISGVTIYAITTSTDIFGMNFTNASLYSLVYNGSYMILNIILAVVIIFFLEKPLRKYI